MDKEYYETPCTYLLFVVSPGKVVENWEDEDGDDVAEEGALKNQCLWVITFLVIGLGMGRTERSVLNFLYFFCP